MVMERERGKGADAAGVVRLIPRQHEGTAGGTVWAQNAPLAGRKVRQCYVLPGKCAHSGTVQEKSMPKRSTRTRGRPGVLAGKEEFGHESAQQGAEYHPHRRVYHPNEQSRDCAPAAIFVHWTAAVGLLR
jgi:hypothetical protein